MSDGSAPYRLAFARRHLETFRAWESHESSPAARDALQNACRHIEQLMRTQPNDWGDPIRNLDHLGMAMYRGLFAGIVVDYAVDEVRRVVYVADLRLAPWHPLAEGD